MDSAHDAVELLKNCSHLVEFLEKDLKSRNEVGFCIGEEGTVFQFREGSDSNITFTLSPYHDERRVVIHTHPSIDFNVTPSDSDLALGERDEVCGMIILAQEMFEVEWNGKAFAFGEDGSTDMVSFRIVCDGSTDGPAEERWVENPRFRFE